MAAKPVPIERRHEEAKAVGLELIGPSVKAKWFRYRWIKCGHETEYLPSHVKGKEITCRQCILEKHEEEAKEAGLEIIGPGKNSRYRLYKWISCGHASEYNLISVRRKEILCRECIDEKLIREAEAAGLKLVGPGKDYSYRLYQHLLCGHQIEYCPPRVRKGPIRCTQCIHERYEIDAISSGFKYLGPGQRNLSKYKCNKCGHEDEYFPPNMKENCTSCDSCLEIKYNLEASEAALTIIGLGKSSDHRLYRWNSCGHENEHLVVSVRNKSIRCPKCLIEKHQQEAKKFGLELIGAGKDCTFRIYKWLSCGHQNEHSLEAVRKGKIHCSICLNELKEIEQKNQENQKLLEISDFKNKKSLDIDSKKDTRYQTLLCECGEIPFLFTTQPGTFQCLECVNNLYKKEAEEAGLELIGLGKKTSYRLYKCKKCGYECEYNFKYVRQKEINCKNCFIEQITEDALRLGLTLIGPSSKKHYYLYKRNSCNHIAEYVPSNLKRKVSEYCQDCVDEKHLKEGLEVNLKLIGEGTSKENRLYECLSCGSQKTYNIFGIRKKTVRCLSCLENRFIDEAKNSGLKLIGPGSKYSKRKYECLFCGHEEEFDLHSVRINNTRCDKCYIQKLEREAIASGVKLIGPGRSVVYKKYQCLTCGFQRDYTPVAVRSKDNRCPKCNPTALTSPSFLYLFLMEDSNDEKWLKLGFSNNPDERLKEFGLPSSTYPKELSRTPISSGNDALIIEKSIHKKYKNFRLDPKQMMDYHTKSGAHECYPITILHDLYQELRRI